MVFRLQKDYYCLKLFLYFKVIKIVPLRNYFFRLDIVFHHQDKLQQAQGVHQER